MQRQGFRIRTAGAILLLAHVLLVGWITLRPLDVPWISAPNFHPLVGIRADLASGWPTAFRRIGGDLVLLAPLGVLLPAVGGRLNVSLWGSLLRTVTAGGLLSLGIELFQTGVPGQVVDVDSLLLNTLGVGVAHLLVVPAVRARLRRRGERSRRAPLPQVDGPRGATPTIPRVGIAPQSDALPASRP
ncbi:VanZ family protein [Streptomyces sp. NPDC002490]|uniref:VanZ family protein n=1 Tax=Streptomyces sp. NPDC002490 TaxID=3154416 RepID=UPI0033246B08